MTTSPVIVGHILKGEIVATINAMTHGVVKKAIKIEFSGEGASTNGYSHVSLPNLASGHLYNMTDARILRGYANHETAHILYSETQFLKTFIRRHIDAKIVDAIDNNPKALKNPKARDAVGVTELQYARFRLWKRLENAIEDWRIESRQRIQWPGSWMNIGDTRNYIIDKESKLLAKGALNKHHPGSILATIVTWRGAVANDYPCKALAQNCLDIARQKWPAEFDDIINAWPRIEAAQSNADVMKIALDIIDAAMPRYTKPQPPSSKPKDAKKDDKKDDKDQKNDGKSDDKNDQSKDKPDDKPDQSDDEQEENKDQKSDSDEESDPDGDGADGDDSDANDANNDGDDVQDQSAKPNDATSDSADDSNDDANDTDADQSPDSDAESEEDDGKVGDCDQQSDANDAGKDPQDQSDNTEGAAADSSADDSNNDDDASTKETDQSPDGDAENDGDDSTDNDADTRDNATGTGDTDQSDDDPGDNADDADTDADADADSNDDGKTTDDIKDDSDATGTDDGDLDDDQGSNDAAVDSKDDSAAEDDANDDDAAENGDDDIDDADDLDPNDANQPTSAGDKGDIGDDSDAAETDDDLAENNRKSPGSSGDDIDDNGSDNTDASDDQKPNQNSQASNDQDDDANQDDNGSSVLPAISDDDGLGLDEDEDEDEDGSDADGSNPNGIILIALNPDEINENTFDIKEILEKLSKEAAKSPSLGSDDNPTLIEVSTERDMEAYSTMLNEAGLAASGAARTLRSMLMSQVRRYDRRFLEEGDFDLSNIPGIATGDASIYRQTVVNRGQRAAVLLLLDHSYSMLEDDEGESRISVLAKASASLLNAVATRRDVSTAIMTYTRMRSPIVKIVSNFDAPPTTAKAALGSILADGAYGGTPTHIGLLEALTLIRKRSEPRKIIFLVTDGEPDDAAQAHEAAMAVEQSGILLAGLGIGSNPPKMNIRGWTSLRKIDDLPEALVGAVSALLQPRS